MHGDLTRPQPRDEVAPVLVWMAGADGRVNHCNGTWLEFRGRTREDEAGEGWMVGVHPDDLARVYGACAQGFLRQVAFRLEFRLRRHDETYRWVFGTVTPKREEPGWIGAFLDISDRKLAEQERMERAHASRQEAITMLAGGMARDFGNLLSPALLALKNLEGRTSEPEQLALAQRAVASASRLGQLLSLLANGRPLRKWYCALEPLLSRRLAATLGDGPVELGMVVDPELPVLQIDEPAIEHLVDLLAVNAREAMPDGGRLEVEATSKDGAVHLVFADNGPGIAPELLPRIFDPYVTTKRGNTGIGLALARAIVHAHEGSITAESTPFGAIFRVHLPLD